MRKKEVIELLSQGAASAPPRAARASSARSRKSYPPVKPGSPLRLGGMRAPYGVPSKAAMGNDPFKMSAVENLAARLDVLSEDLLTILGISGRTAQRRWQEGELAVDESDRLYRMARIVHRAIEVLGSEEGAGRWLKRPQAVFSGAAPLLLLGSDAGAKAVEEQLGRIDHGIFA